VIVERYDGDGATTVVASLNDPHWTVGSRSRLDQPSLATNVFAAGRPTRIEDCSDLPGPAAAASARA
jgi:hypothetical protein